jgi:hypothetical protein
MRLAPKPMAETFLPAALVINLEAIPAHQLKRKHLEWDLVTVSMARRRNSTVMSATL